MEKRLSGDAGADGAPIVCAVRNHIAFITLNRPAALNALSLPMVVELDSLLQRFALDDTVRAVSIAGAGPKAFCAGGDIRALYSAFKNGGSSPRDFFIAEYPLDYRLHRYPKPYLAVLDGITMGGGMGLAQGSTLRVVGEKTRMAMPEVSIGLFPDVGASYFLSRLPGSLGLYLGLTGASMSGADAIHARLADVYLAPQSIASLADDLAALEWHESWDVELHAFIHGRAVRELPESPLALVRDAVDLHFSQPSVAAILASLDGESRADYVDWARRTAGAMRTRSPTMSAVTFEQLRRGASMTLADCLRMELGMVEQCFVQGDFMEGVRALLIDKDNAPRWNPMNLADVTDAAVAAFFRPRWPDAAHPLAGLE